MFSGGLLSSNLTRSLGKIRSRQKSLSKKQFSRESSNSKGKHNAKLPNECYLNWDEYDTRKKNSPNTKPTYTLEVKGKIQFASYAGCLLLLGIAILMMGSLATHLFKKNVFGPIGIGVGIYAIMMAICWLLNNRDCSKKFYHIQDLYSKYATKKYEKYDKGIQVDHTYHSSDEGASNFDSHSQSPDDHLEDPSTMSFTTDTGNEDEESSSLIDDKLDLKNDATEADKNAEKEDVPKEDISKRKIHPELIKRFSMQKLTYDITFQNKPLKVTDC